MSPENPPRFPLRENRADFEEELRHPLLGETYLSNMIGRRVHYTGPENEPAHGCYHGRRYILRGGPIVREFLP